MEIGTLLDTAPKEILSESKFLLEFDFDRLYGSSLENQQYWVHAMKASRCAGRRSHKMGARVRCVQEKLKKKRSLHTKRGVDEVDRQIDKAGEKSSLLFR